MNENFGSRLGFLGLHYVNLGKSLNLSEPWFTQLEKRRVWPGSLRGPPSPKLEDSEEQVELLQWCPGVLGAENGHMAEGLENRAPRPPCLLPGCLREVICSLPGVQLAPSHCQAGAVPLSYIPSPTLGKLRQGPCTLGEGPQLESAVTGAAKTTLAGHSS